MFAKKDRLTFSDPFDIMESIPVCQENLDDLRSVYIDKNGKTVIVVMGHSLGGSAAYAMAREALIKSGAQDAQSDFSSDCMKTTPLG